MAERFAYYGLVGNLITYLMKELGQPMAVAAENVNIWIGVSSIFPVVGAFIADSYLGRFRTILISSVIYLMVRAHELSPEKVKFLCAAKNQAFANDKQFSSS